MYQSHNHDPLKADLRGGVVALGNFDGVHKGHQAVLKTAAAAARSMGVSFGVLLMEPHPVQFFKPDTDPFRLTSEGARIDLLKRCGLDWCHTLTFDTSIAGLSPRAFVSDILLDTLGCSHIVAGSDYRFGKGRAGSIAVLETLGADLGFSVSAVALVEPQEIDAHAAIENMGQGKGLSSTTIRSLIREGRVRRAADLLGHWWQISATVITGDQRGRTLGFPTANLQLGDSLRPREGVYSVRVRDGDHWYDGVANFGRRPTFNKQDQLLEAHLFDFDGDLYGKHLDVSFVEFIRPEQAFDGLDALKKQIADDSNTARQHLADPANQRSTLTLKPV